ncbi:MAG: DUF1127 domain-containing protein [Hyphomicrobiales bacterium]|nr:DUF1127 domain-containing protein [Hyphomicrobiales bacterium]
MQPTARPVARVVNVVVKFLTAWKNRRDFYRLGEMSDVELADIGLTRSDLNVVVDLPFGRDPTTHLGAVAEARRREIETAARQIA